MSLKGARLPFFVCLCLPFRGSSGWLSGGLACMVGSYVAGRGKVFGLGFVGLAEIGASSSNARAGSEGYGGEDVGVEVGTKCMHGMHAWGGKKQDPWHRIPKYCRLLCIILECPGRTKRALGYGGC